MLAAITAGIGAVIGSALLAGYSFVGWGAIMIGIKAGLMTGVFIGGVIITTRIVGLFNPGLAGLMGSVLLQFEDICAAALIHAFCEIMDIWVVPLLSGRQERSYWWRQNVQPLAYAAYCYFLDTNGTIGRLAGAYYLQAFMGASQDEIDFFMLDNYEKAMFRGEAYNFVALDPSHYWN